MAQAFLRAAETSTVVVHLNATEAGNLFGNLDFIRDDPPGSVAAWDDDVGSLQTVINDTC